VTPATSPSTPPKLKPGNQLGWFIVLTAGMAVTGVLAVIFFFNPSTSGFYPVCTFHQLTGLNCPGCGATRATYALVHGHFDSALRDNALFIVALAGTAIRGAWWMTAKSLGRPAKPFFPSNILWAFLVASIVFSILRNLPMFSFLSP
jgi:Protein of unknown function (DUF2752)